MMKIMYHAMVAYKHDQGFGRCFTLRPIKNYKDIEEVEAFLRGRHGGKPIAISWQNFDEPLGEDEDDNTDGKDRPQLRLVT